MLILAFAMAAHALLALQYSPSEAGLRSDERAIAVVVRLQDPASVSPQVDLTPGGLTTHSYFFLRNAGFSIRDTNSTWVEATVRIAPSGHRYTTREGSGIGVTDVAYTVRVRYGRRAFVAVSGEMVSVNAFVWEAERFGVSPADNTGRARIYADLTGCLEQLVASFDAVNGQVGP